MLLDFLTMSSKTTHLLVVAHRKMYDNEFCVPFQEQYEPMVPDEARARYAMVVDGEVMDGKRVKYLTKDGILAKEYLTEIQGLKNWTDAYRGQIDGLKHELAVTKHLLDQVTYGAPPPNPWTERIDKLEQQLAEVRTELSAETNQLSQEVAQAQTELGIERQRLSREIAQAQAELDAKRAQLSQARDQVEYLNSARGQLDRARGRELAAELLRRVWQLLPRPQNR